MANQQQTAGSPRSIGGARQGVKISVVLVFVLVISAGILFLANKAVKEKRRVTLEHQEKRLTLLADGRVQMVKAWLKNVSRQGDRLIKSDLFRLYAAEVNAVEGDLAAIFGAVPMGEPDVERNSLAQQLPMMQNVLREFSTYAGILNARILNREGDAYIATDGYLPPMLDEQLAQARRAMEERSPRFSPLRKTDLGIEVDVYVPIYSPDAREGVDPPVGALMMTNQVSGKITELLSNSALSAKGEKTRLMQRLDGVFRQVTPWTQEGFSDVTASFVLGEKDVIPFAARNSLSDPDHKVFSVGFRVPGPEWWIVQETDFAEAMAPIRDFDSTIYVVAGLGILTALLMAGLAWWILAGVQSRRVAEEFRALAEQIEEQKRFISSVNANIEEFISVKDVHGKYTYVNDAFAEAVGRTPAEMIGLDAEAVFGFDTAKRLEALDEVVMNEGRNETVSLSMYLRSKRHDFQVSKAPYCDHNNDCYGIVEVFRDMTEFLAVQEKNKRLTQRAMEALASTIEATDPYLGGHTKLLAGLSIEVARVMQLSEMDIAEIEAAANLSQIGKVFVPNEVLTKPGKLDAEEMKTMEGHVEHAYRILKDIEIGEGVLKSIYQMNERQDGSGYPARLKDGEIILTARILSVLNVFCAMIRPRSYRGAKTPGEALSILAEESAKFDPVVVRALGDVLKTPTAERLLEE